MSQQRFLSVRRPASERWGADRGFTAVEVLVVALLCSIMAALAIPFTSNTLKYFRVDGDSRALVNGVSLAKMRAASDFAYARFYVDIGARSYKVQTWNKATNQWVDEGGTTTLSTFDNFGFGSAAVAPTDAPSPIAQPPACLNNAGAAIANTACIEFNSRGLPVDGTGTPTALDSLYITDGSTTFGVVVSASGQVRLWRSPATLTPTWTQQ
jgi:prepilin-type N-terminal cleavage/methylation domain-containing protein